MTAVALIAAKAFDEAKSRLAPALDAEGRAGVRGGDFTDDLAVLRATRHRSLSRDTRRNTVGFRCVYEPHAAR